MSKENAPQEEPIFDPFPEPNTMPSGWDLSGFVADLMPAFMKPRDKDSESSEK